MLLSIKKCLRFNSLKYISNHSSYVKFNEENLSKLINKIEISNSKVSNNVFSDLKSKVKDHDLINFVILVESVNFCFWCTKEWKFAYKGNQYSGSMALFMALKSKIESEPEYFSTENLLNIKYNDFKSIFPFIKDEDGSLLKTRYNMFKENAEIIYNNSDNIYSKIESFKKDYKLLNYIIKTFKNFSDNAMFSNRQVMFNKRANLLVRDLFELNDIVNNNIKTIENLFACADYRLPQVLREYDLISFNDELTSIIENNDEIPSNSRYEIEIRANTLYAVEKIKKELKKQGIYMTSIAIDNILWYHTREKKNFKYKYHKTKSIYY